MSDNTRFDNEGAENTYEALYQSIIEDNKDLFLQIDYQSFQEAITAPDRYVEAYERNPHSRLFPVLTAAYRAVKDNNVLSNKDFKTNMYILFATEYHRLLVGEVSFEDFISDLKSFLSRYFADKNFANFWKASYLSKFIFYDIASTELTYDLELIQRDRENLAELTTILKKARKATMSDRMIEIVNKILTIDIQFKEGVEDSKQVKETFQLADLMMSETALIYEHIGSMVDLIDFRATMDFYYNHLFSIKALSYMLAVTEIPRKNISTPLEGEAIWKAYVNRSNKHRDHYFKRLDGITFYEKSPFLDVVNYYFAKRSREVTDELEIQIFNSEIDLFYITFPEFQKEQYLERFRKEFVEVEEESEPEPIPQIIVANPNFDPNDADSPKLLYIENSKESIKDAILALVNEINSKSHMSIDIDAVAERLDRGSIWRDSIQRVVDELLITAPNLEGIRTQLRNNNRVQAIALGGAMRGGEKAILAAPIDDGMRPPKIYCYVVFTVLFTDETNTVEISVEHPDAIKTESGGKNLTDVRNELEEKRKETNKLSHIPNYILNFLQTNPLRDFPEDLENKPIDLIIAEYIVKILSRPGSTFENNDEKIQIRDFLLLCANNSVLFDSIVEKLASLIKPNSSFINFGVIKKPVEILEINPSLIARKIIRYLMQIKKANKGEFDAFTQEAKEIFEILGEPDRVTANKVWVTEDQFRIQICYVEEEQGENGSRGTVSKLETVITWHHHRT